MPYLRRYNEDMKMGLSFCSCGLLLVHIQSQGAVVADRGVSVCVRYLGGREGGLSVWQTLIGVVNCSRTRGEAWEFGKWLGLGGNAAAADRRTSPHSLQHGGGLLTYVETGERGLSDCPRWLGSIVTWSIVPAKYS